MHMYVYVLKQKKRVLEPIRKLGAMMKKARAEADSIEIGEPITIPTAEENTTEPTTNIEIRTPEYVPPAFSSPESEESPT